MENKKLNSKDRDWALKVVMHLLDECESDLLEELYSEDEVERFRNIYAED